MAVSLRDLGDFKTEYSTEEDDFADSFLNPCYQSSNQYNRISGFFSSSVFHLLHDSLERFYIGNAGKTQLLCSPRLSGQDADAVIYGYRARDDGELFSMLNQELQDLLRSDWSDSARLLAALIARGSIDLRLAQVAASASSSYQRMVHDKVGLFIDDQDDFVGFRGSSNETFLGFSETGNIESIDVWPSWDQGRDAGRAMNARNRFERIWRGAAPGVRIVSLPDEMSHELERVSRDVDVVELMRQVSRRRATAGNRQYTVGPNRLRRHQRMAYDKWYENARRGLLAHATGSGKTITGLYCAKQALGRGLVPIILVPSKLLLEQWARQASDYLGLSVVLVGGGHDRWRALGLVRAALRGGTEYRPYAIVALINTATSAAFRGQVGTHSDRTMVIVDEAHRLGSKENKKILDWLKAPWRLGLSATPQRANDAEGTSAVLGYFGGIVHTYSLKDALDDGVLAPYMYHPSWIGLDGAERQRWDNLTAEIKKRAAMTRVSGGSSDSQERLQRKLIERSRIAKGASRKIPHAVGVLLENYNPDRQQKWLVYCDSQEQVADLRLALAAKGVNSWEYHSQMIGDQRSTLRLFDQQGGIIVSIRCLDEGVDIPSATHAMILASSRNPREFIQRRGRVLRTSCNKVVANVFDVLVLPDNVDKTDPMWSLAVGELARAQQFARWALGEAALSRIESKWVDMGLDLEDFDRLIGAGVEADDEQNDNEDVN